jgi:hypothetical protein
MTDLMYGAKPSYAKVYLRAFTPNGQRLTIEARSFEDCKRRLRLICRDFGLPWRATLAKARLIRKRYV